MRGLITESSFVEGVADDADREDGDGEGVAAIEGFAAGEFRDRFVAVFASCCQIPESGVEDDGGGGNCSG